MGCLPGNSISLIQKAPFNDPLYLKIDGSHLAIRKETAQYIFVRLKKHRMSTSLNVALLGNPNTGKKHQFFNRLTGLTQKVGNYPGITVEKKEGVCKLNRTTKAHLLDLPGTYSLNASSMDESVGD